MLNLAFRSLFVHPARNAFTVFSVTIAMMLVTFVVATQLRTQQMTSMLKGRNNLIVDPKGPPLSLAAKEKVAALPGVKRVIHMIVVDATSPDKKLQLLLHATTPEYMTISDSWFYVPPEDMKRWDAERMGALVGRHTARDLNLKVGSRINIDTEIGSLPIVVTAISPKGYKSTGVIVHYEYFTESFNRQNRVNVLWVELLPGSDLKSLARTIDEMFRNTDTPTVSYSTAAFLKMSAQAASVIPTLLTGAGLIILLATLLVTANTIAISIRERIPELATLRAIGFRRGRILRLLITEVLIVCLAGGILGGLVPVLVFQRGVEIGSGLLTVGKVELPPELLIWILLLSIALALLASVVPAWRASRADVASSLRAQA